MMTYQIREENAMIESVTKLSGKVTIPISSESVYPAVLLSRHGCSQST
jgi:hypothetical protein